MEKNSNVKPAIIKQSKLIDDGNIISERIWYIFLWYIFGIYFFSSIESHL